MAIPEWQAALAEAIPAAYRKEISRGKYKFTTIEAYYGIRRASEILGPCGQGWTWRIHPGYPQLIDGPTGQEVIAVGVFLWRDPASGEWTDPFPVAGGVKVVGSVGDAFKGAMTRLVSDGLSRLLFGIEIYAGGSIDTHLAHEAYDTRGPRSNPSRSAPGTSGGVAPPAGTRPGPHSSRRGPPPGWIACAECGEKRKPLANSYGPYIQCKSCGGKYQNLTPEQAEHAHRHGELEAWAVDIARQNAALHTPAVDPASDDPPPTEDYEDEF